MMATRVGIGVSVSGVRAVVMQGARVIWHSQSTVTEEKPLAESLGELFEAAPIKGWRRLPAFISVGPSLSIVRRLSGLPPVPTDAIALEMVRSNVDRFLPRLPETSCVIAAMTVEPGEIWIATVDEQAIDAVRGACEHAKVRLRTIAPACFLLASTLAEPSASTRMRWSDGSASLDVELKDGEVSTVTRVASGLGDVSDCDSPQLSEHLRQLGAESRLFADAYGAALLGDRAPLRSRSIGRAQGSAPGISRWRLMVAASAVVLGMVSATAAPILSAATSRASDSTRLRAIAESAKVSAIVEAELRKLDASLRALADFEGTRVSPSELLASVTRALPKETALVALAFDSSGGSLVAIGRNVLGVVASLDSVEQIGKLRATSPVTRESSNGLHLERIAIAFTSRGTDAPIAARAIR